MGIFSSLLGGGGMMVPQPADAQMATAAMPYMGQPQPQPIKQKRPFAESTFGGILGMIGDALLVANGRAPMYAPQMEQRRTANALSNYLGNLEPGLADVIQASPEVGLKLWELKHPKASDEPETLRLLRAAGIDPASEQGRSILTSKLSGSGDLTPFVRNLQAVGVDPHSDEGMRLLYASLSPSGFIIEPPKGGGPVAGGEGGTQGLPRVSSPDEARKLPPGSKFIMPDGRVGTVPGGPTATPSASFP